MSEFATVISALNEGFVETLKLFLVTLVGSIPLGLIICFGSMNRWAPLGAIGRRYIAYGQRITRALEAGETLNGLDGAVLTTDMALNKAKMYSFQGRLLLGFRPISLISRFIVWVIRGTPLMLQLLIVYYIPGFVLPTNPWSFPEGRFAALGSDVYHQLRLLLLRDIPRRHTGRTRGTAGGRAGARHDQEPDFLQGHAFADDKTHRPAHGQRGHYPRQGHFAGAHHLLPGGHLGRIRLP